MRTTQAKSKARSAVVVSVGAALLAVSACGSDAEVGAAGQEQKQIVVYGTLSMEPLFAGELGDRIAEAGVDVQYEPMLTSQIFTRSLALKSNPEASLIFLDTSNYPQGVEAGLFQEVDISLMPEVENLMEDAQPPALDNLGIGVYAHTLVHQYRADLLETAGIDVPTTPEGLMDPALNGRVGLTSLTSVAGVWELLTYAWAEGGDVEDIDPGFELAAELASSGQVAYFGRSGSDMTQALQQEEIWVAAQYGPSALNAAASDPTMAFTYLDVETPIQLTAAAIPTNAPDYEAAHIVLNEIASKETQTEFATEIYQVPVREDLDREEVTPGMDEVEKGRVTLRQLEELTGTRASDVDWNYIGQQLPAWTNRWNSEVEAS